MTSINKQLGSIARPEPDISDWPAHPEHGEHLARKEKLQAIRRGLGIPARTSQHRDS
jgi:hypothetical protein